MSSVFWPRGRDFTIGTYEALLDALLQNGYVSVIPFESPEEEFSAAAPPAVILRHDVDRDGPLTVRLAQAEQRRGLRAVYYFRKIRGPFASEDIREVSALGHRIGYHYETLSKANGDFSRAMEIFRSELAELRRVAPVETAAMHGSPLSRWDNRRLWDRHDYHELGIKFEPYFDLDFKRVAYLTDTGRRWDGGRFAIRDRVSSPYSLPVRTTMQLVAALNRQELPARLMLNCHPHRWDSRAWPWLRELVGQSLKNQAKRIIRRIRP